MEEKENKKFDVEKYNKGKQKFRDYWAVYIDKETQHTEKLDDLESLILKPQKSKDGILSLTKEEIEEYMKIDVEELKKTEMNMKTIIIYKTTQEIIKDKMEDILKKKENAKKEKDENER